MANLLDGYAPISRLTDMRTIDDFFLEAAPQTLYHYTGIDALLGMAKERKVWASHVYYLTDSAEILRACIVLKEVLLQRLDSCGGEEHVFITQFRDWLDTCSSTPHHLFVF